MYNNITIIEVKYSLKLADECFEYQTIEICENEGYYI